MNEVKGRLPKLPNHVTYDSLFYTGKFPKRIASGQSGPRFEDCPRMGG
jgi:hypothetical protein